LLHNIYETQSAPGHAGVAVGSAAYPICFKDRGIGVSWLHIDESLNIQVVYGVTKAR